MAEKNVLLEQYSYHLENATVQSAGGLEEKDGHTRRVTELSVLLGEAAMIGSDNMLVLRRASQFHDIANWLLTSPAFNNPVP